MRKVDRPAGRLYLDEYWEIMIKSSLGKLPLPAGSITDAIITQGFRVFAVAAQHVEATRALIESLQIL